MEEVLAELGLAHKPRLLALNKIDLLANEAGLSGEELVDYYFQHLGLRRRNILLISAARGWGLRRLLQRIAEMLAESRKT